MALQDMATLQFSCACKQVGGSVEVPASAIPLSLSLCHCNICRRQTGLLAALYVTLPDNHQAFNVHGTTTIYAASEGVLRHFCSTCGSNVLVDDQKTKEILICSGAITSSGIETRLEHNIFVTDTKDGGMSTWLPLLQGWEGFSKESKPVDCGRRLPENSEEDVSATSLALPVYCQCRKIHFTITRPNEESSNLHGPYSDLLAPYVSDNPRIAENQDDVKWWLRRQGSRYLAGICACNSCRLNSGFDIQAWAFIPKVNLFDSRGDPLDIEIMQGLTEHKSSEGVHRHFCSQCGATVFWRGDARPDLIDVSVGLLGAEEGARAESWLSWWTNRISFEELAPNKTLIGSLKDGLEKWGEQAGNQQQ